MNENKTINNYLKKIKLQSTNGIQEFLIFDFDAMWNDKAPYFICISERGRRGKSYGGKLILQQKYLENKIPTLFLKNLELQMKIEKSRFLSAVKNLPEFKDFETTSQGVHKNNEYSIYFTSLNKAETNKGSREEVQAIVYDEFMDGINNVRGDQTFLFKSVLDTYSNPLDPNKSKLKKIFILGNYKTLNSKLLIDMGIYKIEQELTTINDSSGNPLIRILVPQLQANEKAELKNFLKGSLVYELGELTNQNEYSLFNQNIFDIINNIIEINNKQLEEAKHELTILEKFYYHIFWIDNHYHIIAEQDFKNNSNIIIYRFSKKSLREFTYELSTNIKNNFIGLLENGKITFQNIATRANFITDILK